MVRLALGAGRGRLVRQLLTESVLLALLGGLAGLLVASWTTSALLALLFSGARTIPITVQPDARVIGFTLLISCATAVLFGVAPGLRASAVELGSALKTGSRTVADHLPGRSRLSGALVVWQVALSLLLLVGAGLLLRSLHKLKNQDLGFDRDNMLLIGIDPALAGYKPEQVANLYRRLQERITALPGVRSATLAQFGLMGGTQMVEPVSVPGYAPAPGERMSVQVNTVAPGYFETTGMRVLLGRGIAGPDDATSRKVGVINETMAHLFFAHQNPIGRHFRLGGGPGEAEEVEIIGLAKDAKYNNLREETPGMVFLPLLQQQHNYAGDVEVRAAGDPAGLANEIRRAIVEIDSNLPIIRVTALTAEVNRSLNQERLIANLSTVFGLLALLLACVGLYGLMSFSVARRTNEIGVRMALGARRADVLWMVLRESLILIGAGVLIGIPLSMGLSRLIANQLFGLKTHDPLTLLAAVTAMTAVAGIAAYLLARRATKVDPMVALRYE
jgi:predicted permease